ncbi:hypothetical protein [Streptomyces griseorubiginosus]|uniref:hypothetical protein n=1 Tax=Streptomyces griseorubiginosus TaxID=67304 RepID=UPI0036E95410
MDDARLSTDPLRTEGSATTLAVLANLMRAFLDRGLPQDVIDVHAACQYRSVIELEQLGEVDPVELRERLESVVWISDEEFSAHGLTPGDIAELRRWALDWEADLGLRILEEYDEE